MKTICFLVTSLESGGAENYLLRYLRFDKMIKPIVICKSGKRGILEQQYLNENATIITIPPGYFNVSSWFKVYKLFKKHNVQAVCDFTGNFAGIYLMIAKLAGVDRRISFYRRSSHAYNPTFINKMFDGFVNKLVSRFATNILANSWSGINFFHPNRDVRDVRFQVIYNGIDEKEFVSSVSKEAIREELKIPNGAFVVGHSGRLNVAKNHETILKTAEVIVEKHDDIFFMFCGKDTELLMQQTNSKRLKERLILLGYRPDVNRVLKTVDLYFFPSVTEGQPNALIEAMVTGIPFIASDIDPIKEVIPEELSGNILDPFDILGFAEKISSCYLDRVTLANMSCKEYAVELFDAKTNFNKLSQLL